MGNTEKVNKIKHIYPLSPMQEGMLFHSLKDIDNGLYVGQSILTLKGELDIELFKESFNILINRYDILKTVFSYGKTDRPRQVVLNERSSDIEYIDISLMNEEERQVYLEEFISRDRQKGFDLKKDMMMRISILRLDGDTFSLIWTYHHIIIDGWCLGILFDDFFNIYTSLKEKKRPSLPKTRQYVDYIKWLEVQDRKACSDYWKSYMKDYDGDILLPRKTEAAELGVYVQKEISFKLSEAPAQALTVLAKKYGITLNTILQAAWGILLQKYNDGRDAVFGAVVSGRSSQVEGIESMMGIFINTIPVRVGCEAEASFDRLLKELSEAAAAANQYCYYPLSSILSESNLRHDLINHIIAFQNYPMDSKINEINSFTDIGFNISGFRNTEIINYDFYIVITPGDEIDFRFIFNEEAYEQSTIELLAEHYVKIINTVTENPDIMIRDIEIMTEQELQRLLPDFNNTAREYPSDKTINQLFEEQVLRTPDKTAVLYGDKKLTYSELNNRANQLAEVLRREGICREAIVGLLMNRSAEAVAAMLAVLKAGGAYLPIDTKIPSQRIRYMLEDSGAKVLLVRGNEGEEIDFHGKIIDITDSSIYCEDAQNLPTVNDPSSLAYVIYTSGSTGKPKGTMIEQRGFTNYIWWAKEQYLKNDEEVFAFYSSISFDLTVTSIFTPLLTGNTIAVYESDDNEFVLYKILKENTATVIKLTPAHLSLIKDMDNRGSSIKRIIVGGENLTVNLAKMVYDSFGGSVEIINEYGPTETVVGCMLYRFDPGKDTGASVSIGLPADNVRIYILDKDMDIVPPGVKGELYISGDGVARGYLNRPELTMERFIKNPFDSTERMYKTGDAAKWLPEGNVQFLGRLDNQVKIRGFRIEPEEIANQLLTHMQIKEAVVIAGKYQGDDLYLCAYIVSDVRLQSDELREFLKSQLPEYMIPSYFIQVDKIPLTGNGKVDRDALPGPKELSAAESCEKPTGELEQKLAQIWEEVLEISNVSVNSSFFDLGGHSLKAIELAAKIHKKLNVEIALNEIFDEPTIKGISRIIEQKEEKQYSSIRRIEDREYYPVSSAQKRIYTLQQLDKESTGYNISDAVFITGKLQVERVEQAFVNLIKRHEALRTHFEVLNGEIIQKVHKTFDFKLDYTEAGDENTEESIKSYIRAFDLGEAPLLRAKIIRLCEDRYILIFDMHHIISDGVSLSILMKEFAELYEERELGALTLQYRDYAVWQNTLLKSGAMRKQEEYWLERFAEEAPILNMPCDYERPPVQSFEGGNVDFELDGEMTRELYRLAKETDSTIYMVLLSAYNILLAKYSRQEDIVIGSPIFGRTHEDLQNIIGMFVNTLPMRNYPKGEKTYLEFLKEVRQNSLSAFQNSDYQLEELVDKLGIKKDMSRNPLFDTMFILQNISFSELNIKDFVLKPCNYEKMTAKVDLTLTAEEGQESISCSFNYCTGLFKEKTIEAMAEHFKVILKTIIANNSIPIAQINMITPSERQKILYEFNNTAAAYESHKTIQELFEEQVKKTPDNTALIFGERQLTYRELNERANSLARVLRKKGVRPDDFVAVMAERSLEMIIGIMGILKAGGAYLPIYPHYPSERIEYMLEDSGAAILLTQGKSKAMEKYSGQIIDLEDGEIYKESVTNPERVSMSENLVYVIYTSGSTGKPKGVMVEHRALINRISWAQAKYPLNAGDTILQKTIFTFDVSAWEIFWSLLYGAKLCMLLPGGEKDPLEIAGAIEKYDISIIHFVPSMLEAFLTYYESCKDVYGLKSLKKVFCSGEELKRKQVSSFKRLLKDKSIINLYGPTEAAIEVSCFDCSSVGEDDRTIPIGKPIDNIKLFILDNNKNLQPIGIPGELCIAGAGLARGYLNKPMLTKEKFIDNPFELSGEKMYRTGDLTKWREDGNIEFLGRIDNQVKIRGFRIELNEIEAKLLEHSMIREALVLDREDQNSNKYLCAYLVAKEQLETEDIKMYLSGKLPDYMIPSHFVQIDKIPLGSNGKVDRKALPQPELTVKKKECRPPENEIEAGILELWKMILGFEDIGVTDSFFELGGNSIKLILLISKIYEEFNINISVNEMASSPTIRGTALKILNNNTVEGIKYQDYKTADVMTLWNEKYEKSIFAFPPLGGFGFAYKELAGLVESCSIYGFDFIEDENRIEKYVELITSVKQDAYILLGYSAGGNLAFEVAKELERNNFKVSNIILIDSYAKDEKILNTYEDIKIEAEQAIDFIEKEYGIKGTFNINYLRGSIKQRLEKYLEYYNNLINEGKISSKIHLVIGQHPSEDTAAKLEAQGQTWKTLTDEDLIVYHGYGEHLNMLRIEEHLRDNTKIINEILKTI